MFVPQYCKLAWKSFDQCHCETGFNIIKNDLGKTWPNKFVLLLTRLLVFPILLNLPLLPRLGLILVLELQAIRDYIYFQFNSQLLYYLRAWMLCSPYNGHDFLNFWATIRLSASVDWSKSTIKNLSKQILCFAFQSCDPFPSRWTKPYEFCFPHINAKHKLT